jgi:transcriptional regulator with XRE-family HTH domain
MGARIRAERKRLGLILLEVAERMGMGGPNYRRLEFAANPCYGTLVGLVRLVGMDVRAIAPELFEGDPGRERVGDGEALGRKIWLFRRICGWEKQVAGSARARKKGRLKVDFERASFFGLAFGYGKRWAPTGPNALECLGNVARGTIPPPQILRRMQ